jgi:hypothetical protein
VTTQASAAFLLLPNANFSDAIFFRALQLAIRWEAALPEG